MLYTMGKIVLRFLYLFIFRVTVIGQENIPKDGAVIFCANHSSNFDPVTMALYVPKRKVHYMAKKELFQNKLLGWLFKQLYAFPVDRSNADMTAFKSAVKILKSGETLGMFAQGTRVKEGEEKAAKAGVALFAMKGNAPVVPVAISGSGKLFTKVRISYGNPLNLEEYRGKRLNTESLEQITNLIMLQINQMRSVTAG